MKDAVNIDCLRSQPRVSVVSSFLLSPSFASGLVFKSVSKEIQANELYSTWYVTCSFLSRNVKNSHRSVGSSTRLEQKLYNFLNVFTKHFICRCHRDNNPDKTSNANQVSATGRLSKEACFFYDFACHSKPICLCLQVRASTVDAVIVQRRVDKKKEVNRSIHFISLHSLQLSSDRRLNV